MDDIVSTFEKTLNSETTRELIVDWADIALSKLIESNAIDGIPIFGLLNSGRKLLRDFRNLRFAQKIYRFLFDTKDISILDQVEFISNLAEANKENGYEILLSVIDRMDNVNKITTLTNFVRHRVYGHITIEEFMRLTMALERTPYPDIKKLPNYIDDCYELGVTDMLNAAGLLYESIIDANKTTKYKINKIGRDFLKYGLEVDIEDKGDAPVQIPGFDDIATGLQWKGFSD